MLEQKLIVGRYINLNLAPPVPAYNVGDFVRVLALDCYLQESTGTFKKTSVVQAAQGPKARRNFKWLPWLPGGISEVALVGSDVLTGPMSGCWLVTYRKANGVPHAGHLGTDVASPVNTAAVNNAWNAFAVAHAADVIGGFNPLRHWNGAMPVKLPAEPAVPPKIFGLYTIANQFYIVIGFQQANSATTFRIAGIQQVPSVTVARLQHVDQPGP